MVFSSVPLYLDPPNWNNQQQQVTILLSFRMPFLSYMAGGWHTHIDR
jgi:hypothetical protein